ncbi:hypothetical protein JOQ06_001577 [Pogonophryne albipinna]|uniref:DBIRD complex subunit ZNF326 n=1 Tax=Pogonophryne albipinna TaxID=1090488 RepID=A0AAD6B527_9TELE|nr:hypothetical protein JOQ06_001577 [Pogonophryne albipinna]
MMNRQSKAPPNLSAKGAKAAAPAFKQQQPQQRIPQEFKEAMLHIPVKPAVNSQPTFATAANAKSAKKRPAQTSVDKWRSSFQPLGDGNYSMDESNEGSRRVEIYDPYDPVSSDSEHEMLQAQNRNQSPPDQDNQLEHQHLSPGQDCQKKRCFASTFIESVGINMQDLSPETGPSEDSSTQHFPPSYGEQRTNGEERITVPEYMRQMTKVRLSPPRLQRDYPLLLESRRTGSTGLDHVPPSSDVPRIRKLRMIMDTIPCDISCDLCDVEFINGLELDDHLESKSHWDILEYIQQHNNYDDVTIAFIQEVMLHKSHQCTRTIESSALQALQENDHMTKIEMFHCAACSVFLSTAASSVHAHITSQEHLVNTKDFQVERRLSCLDKAETIMKKLKHQFEHFLEVFCKKQHFKTIPTQPMASWRNV